MIKFEFCVYIYILYIYTYIYGINTFRIDIRKCYGCHLTNSKSFSVMLNPRHFHHIIVTCHLIGGPFFVPCQTWQELSHLVPEAISSELRTAMHNYVNFGSFIWNHRRWGQQLFISVLKCCHGKAVTPTALGLLESLRAVDLTALRPPMMMQQSVTLIF